MRGALLLGCLPLSCGEGDEGAGAAETDGAAPEPLEEGCLRADPPGADLLPFEEQEGRIFGELSGSGLDGRRYTDLTRLSSQRLLTPLAEFYVRTRYPDTLEPGRPWSVSLGGLVEQPTVVDAGELVAQARDQGEILLECSGNFRAGGFGLMSVARFRGVPLDRVLGRVAPRGEAALVEVVGYDVHSVPSAGGRSTEGASWVVSPEQWRQTGAFLATHMNDEPLPLDHGSPLRLVNPGWYGCSCIKWVRAIDWVAADHPATSQMQEFAGRTHQEGVPALAREYSAPEIQAAAMPVRVERWRSESGTFYVVVGISWGGAQPPTALELSFDGGESYRSVPCGQSGRSRSWRLWSTLWEPTRAGRYDLTCRIPDPSVPARRLDARYYRRRVVIPEPS